MDFPLQKAGRKSALTFIIFILISLKKPHFLPKNSPVYSQKRQNARWQGVTALL
jgi:hypothetical protein